MNKNYTKDLLIIDSPKYCLIFLSIFLLASCSYFSSDSLNEDDILEAMIFHDRVTDQGTDYRNVDINQCVFRNQFGEESKEMAPSFDFWACNYSVDARVERDNIDWSTIELTGIFKRADVNLHYKSAGYSGKVVLDEVGKQVSLDMF
ncbi:hypothetical protein [Psychrobacter sp. Pi2-51]|uniref:hypothetical protein n=1 Tax=Psychrobacter sp. Pi2-51 TaxID=2774132 RepID=UPI00191A47FB|nr:hypothetical protein [Psychrobacter sp. Pi2-51]